MGVFMSKDSKQQIIYETYLNVKIYTYDLKYQKTYDVCFYHGYFVYY